MPCRGLAILITDIEPVANSMFVVAGTRAQILIYSVHSILFPLTAFPNFDDLLHFVDHGRNRPS